MKSAKAGCLGVFALIFLGITPAKATQIEITVDAASTAIVLLEGTIEFVTRAGEVITLGETWKGGSSGEKLQVKAKNGVTECIDQLEELRVLLGTVLNGASVSQHDAHTEAVLAKAAFEPVGKIVAAGGTDVAIIQFSPLETEITSRLTQLVDTLTPAQPTSPDCSSCGDPACCEAGSRCCQDPKACPNGC